MLHSEEKTRQMMRSILPSKSRENASYEKKALNRKLRRKSNMATKSLLSELDWEESTFDFNYDAQEVRTYIVKDRRGADKLSHFIRWAEHKTKDIPDGSKMPHIKSILNGKGLIYEHACGHLRGLNGFEENPNTLRRFSASNRRDLYKEDLIEALEKICNVRKFHRYLNDTLRNEKVKVYQHRIVRKEEIVYYDTIYRDGVMVNVGEPKVRIHYHTVNEDVTMPTRLLMGVHDINDFVEDIIKASLGCPRMIRKKGYLYGNIKNYAHNPEFYPGWLLVVERFVEDYIIDPSKLCKFSIGHSYKTTTWDNAELRRLALSGNYEFTSVYTSSRNMRYTHFKWNL